MENKQIFQVICIFLIVFVWFISPNKVKGHLINDDLIVRWMKNKLSNSNFILIIWLNILYVIFYYSLIFTIVHF